MNNLLERILDTDCNQCEKRKKNSHDCEYHKLLQSCKSSNHIDEWTESNLKKAFKGGTCPWLVLKETRL